MIVSLFDKVGKLYGGGEEEKLTNAISQALVLYTNLNRLRCVWSHVANECHGSTKKDIRAIHKKHCMGMINGAPDFFFVGKEGAVLVEIKSKSGKLSHSQKLYKSWCDRVGAKYLIAYSLEDVLFFLKANKLFV